MNGQLRDTRDASRIPVIVGVGETLDRPDHDAAPREPARLMADALIAADRDTGGASLLPALDSLDVINSVSWHYPDCTARVAGLLGHRPARLVYGPVGGETPIQALHDAAVRIADGHASVAAVCGGEAAYTVARARRDGVNLPWPAEDPAWKVVRSGDLSHPLAAALDVAQPLAVYPFYENAGQAAAGRTPRQGLTDAAQLWARFAQAATTNPHAWIRDAPDAAAIATVSPSNRMIAWPYPKLMIANPLVNQGAAVLITSLARARAAGIDARSLVYFRVGASAQESADYLQRDQYVRSHAMEVVLEHCRDAVTTFGAMELYSCFPCVPAMATRALGPAADGMSPTVTGGLSFFGAPLNNYMGHAVAAMVRHLRDVPDSPGLLYGQGGFVSRHHALVLSADPQAARPLAAAHSLDAQAQARRAPAPRFDPQLRGPAALESHTVLFARDGTPRHGAAILRTPDGRRTLARVSRRDRPTFAALLDPQRNPIGMEGVVHMGADAIPEWSLA